MLIEIALGSIVCGDTYLHVDFIIYTPNLHSPLVP